MGGLAARAYLQGLAQVNSSSPRIAYRRDIVQLITVGTPHKGAEIVFMCSQISFKWICEDPLVDINVTSIAAQSLQPNSEALSSTSQLGLNNFRDNPLPSEVKYVSIIGTGQLTLPRRKEDGDGIVSVISQNLGMLAGTSMLAHESKKIFITKREDCGVDKGPFKETHTCEPGDPGIWAELLNRFYQCHTINSRGSIPPGFGAPYNVLSRQQELLLTASCTSDTTGVSVGNGDTGNPAQNYYGRQLVYYQGHEWDGSQWRRQVNFQCAAAIESNVWCVGSATGSIPIDSPWYLAFTCVWTGNQWKCGCRDLLCNPTNLWQIQGIRR
jgi:hypothetical protein